MALRLRSISYRFIVYREYIHSLSEDPIMNYHIGLPIDGCNYILLATTPFLDELGPAPCPRRDGLYSREWIMTPLR